MKIYPVTDPSFRLYGEPITHGYNVSELLRAMEAIPLPEEGTAYEPAIESLEACSIFSQLQDRAYGGLPIQLGMCWGRNTKLNCLEYHRDSEVNLGTGDFILLLAKRHEMENGVLDTKKVRAFRVPGGLPVEIHRVAVVLPRGTNTDKPAIAPGNAEDRLLFARNKWLLAHPDSAQAAQGAYIGLMGENLDLSDQL